MYIYRSIEAVSLILLSKEPNHFQCGLDAPKIRAWSVCSRGSFMFFPVEMCCKYVGGSKNRGTPNHPKLDHFSIETHGDLGYLHFRNSPFVANMYTQCIYVTCTTWHRMQLSRCAHTHRHVGPMCIYDFACLCLRRRVYESRCASRQNHFSRMFEHIYHVFSRFHVFYLSESCVAAKMTR